MPRPRPQDDPQGMFNDVYATVLAEQRRTELLADADRFRLAQLVRAARRRMRRTRAADPLPQRPPDPGAAGRAGDPRPAGAHPDGAGSAPTRTAPAGPPPARAA